jgi:hypothetical protein
MTCRSLEHAIVEVARGRDVGRGTIAAVESHVEQCEACAARLAREQRLSDGLRALAAATATAAPSAALEEQLMTAFAAEHTPAMRKRVVPAVAAAAAIVVALSWLRTPPAIPARPAAVDRPQPMAPPAQDAVTPASAGHAPTRADVGLPRRAGRRRPPPPRDVPGDSGFIALPAAIGLPDFESGVIVRLELPPAALPAYGLEVVPESKSPVEADLLIGQDGKARAIRLVNRSLTRSGAEQ